MCFLEKVDYLIWIELDGFDGKLMLRLERDRSGKAYNDFFTVERAVGGATGTELLFTLPFDEIRGITYQTSTSDAEPCTISIDTEIDDRFRKIKVPRHCFNYFYFRKMIKIYEKRRKTALS